jgi:hypothetical protein
LVDKLRPYQQEIARAVLSSVFEKKGLTFTVEISRQGGKNELSAQLELLLLTFYMGAPPQNIIKCAPTFKPQTIISMQRLKDRLNDVGFSNLWRPKMGYIMSLGNCRVIFLSADKSASTVGNTAHLLLEIDEAQDINKTKFNRDFKPMGASTNVTTVLYGTAWNSSTLLEETKQSNLKLEAKDGIRRHFEYNWEEVARYNPDYANYVETERARLGESHPLFQTQYMLKPLSAGDGFFSRDMLALLQGSHSRQSAPEAGRFYIAGVDIAGEAEEVYDHLADKRPHPDSTVITIAEVSFAAGSTEPTIKIVEHYAWTGEKHAVQHSKLLNLLGKRWKCRKVIVDATGIGQPVASFLKETLGSRVKPFVFTSRSKSELGFALLAAVNSGRLQMYRADDSPEYMRFRQETERAKACYRSGQRLNFYVSKEDGNDDFLMSLALVVKASADAHPRMAKGSQMGEGGVGV